MDVEARKQLLLTRIALERAQLQQDVEVLRQAASPANLASQGLHALIPDGLLRSIFGRSPSGQRSSAANLGSRAFHALMLWRRYSIVLTLLGGLMTRIVAGRRLRRLVTLGTFGAAIAGGIWLTKLRARR